MQKGYIYAVVAAVLFGSSGMFVKMVQADGLDSISLLTVQYMIAVVIMFSYALLRNKKVLLVGKRSLMDLAVMGVIGSTGMTVCYYMAFEYLPVAVVTMLLYTYPVIVFIYTFIFEKGSMNVKKTAAIVMAFVGGVLALNIAGGNYSYPAIGIILGLMSAVFYAFINIFSEKRLEAVDALAINAYTTLFSLITLCIYRFPSYVFRGEVNPDSILYIVLLAVFCEVLPLTLLYAAIKHIGALKVSVISNIEIPTAIIMAYLFLYEKITLSQLAGSMLIVCAVILIRNSERA
ncbi:MAG TPA: DMT family transporter [Clostridiaceae bacterium]|nr:DMT family transporter [Clostridiaceae bacterium]